METQKNATDFVDARRKSVLVLHIEHKGRDDGKLLNINKSNREIKMEKITWNKKRKSRIPQEELRLQDYRLFNRQMSINHR